MKISFAKKRNRNCRENERGAALVTSLFIGILMLAAGGALILSTSLANTTAVDSTAETQAYYAAEAGMQETLNVFRGNKSPVLTFSQADATVMGNAAGDSATWSRLSNWLTYDSTYTDRVVLTSNYSPLNGLAYKVAVYAVDPESVAQPGLAPSKDNFQKPANAVPQPTPSWHQWHCGHCSWDYSHHPYCQHKHCTNPNGNGRAAIDDTRMLVDVTGFGPKGAVKQLEMMVKRVFFDYDTTPAVVVMRGPSSSTSSITLKIGSTKDNIFTGKDLFAGSTTTIDGFGFTSSADFTAGDNYIQSINHGKIILNPDDLLLDNTTLPDWLQSGTNADGTKSADRTRALLVDLETIAVNSGRYFTTTNQPATYGSDSVPAFTFVDGTFNLPAGKHGGGLLVVTGTLNMQKDATWDGLILCLGSDPAGNPAKFTITGNGNGYVKGALVIAPFVPSNIGDDYLGPVFDTSGGNDPLFQYDSGEVRDAIYTLGARVVGIHEL
jgi:hypothetical protein